MQTLEDLIPELDRITELYQSEIFKPLLRFLSRSRKELEQDIHQLNTAEKGFKVKMAVLIAQSNLLGTLKELPFMIKAVKKTIEDEKANLEKMKSAAHDPLGDE